MDEIECRSLLRDYVLPPDEVHVWRVTLDWPPAQIEVIKAVLAIDEQQKAGRFHFAADRSRYVIGRGVLRTLLARCAKMKAERLSFEYSAFGKPRLANGLTEVPLQFNVSHADELVLIGLTTGRAVGIDVERMRNDLEVERIAGRFFSPHERLTLQSLPEHLRLHAFFDCWTRKEAYIKAVGNGLSLPLDQFDVGFLPGQEAELLATRPNPAEARRWIMQALNVGADYKAAIVVEGAGWQLKMRDWPVNSTG